MRFFPILLLSILVLPVAHASIQVYPDVYFYVNGYYVAFTENNFTEITVTNETVSVVYNGRTLVFKPENANITIAITDNTIIIKAYAPKGTISKIYVEGFKPNRVLLNNSGVKRVLSIDYLAPNSYYMNQTTLVLCGEHESTLVWKLLVLPFTSGGGGGVLAITTPQPEYSTTTYMEERRFSLELGEKTILGIIVLAILLVALYYVASSSKRW